MKKIILGNAFSLNMLGDLLPNVKVSIDAVSVDEIKTSGFHSVVGHADTANVLSDVLGVSVVCNRETVSLKKDDVLYVAQLMGGRLPEGSTKLPEGYSFTFLKVTIL